MKKTKIYQYSSSKGTVLTAVNLEIGNPKILYQLIAENDKILTNGIIRTHCVNTIAEEIHLWQEVEKTEEEKMQQSASNDSDVNYKLILDIITGNEE